MSLRVKTLFVASAVFVIFFLLQSTWLADILLRGFRKLEEDQVNRNMSLVQQTFRDDITDLSEKLGDWAAWDDAYAYVKDKNPAFEKSNLMHTTLESMRINAMVFMNEQGSIIATLGHDEVTGDATVSAALLAHLTPGSFLLRFDTPDSVHEGIINLPEDPMLVALKPIVKSDRTGPIRGTLLFGKYLRPSDIKKLSERTHTETTIARFPSESMSAEFRSAAIKLSSRDQVIVQPQDRFRTVGYGLETDVYNLPAFLYSVKMPRDVLAAGEETIRTILTSVFIAGIAFILAALVIMDRMTLGRIFRISDDARQIAASGSLSGRIRKIGGNDEVSALGTSINAMLEAIEAKQYLMEGERAKAMRYLAGLPVLFVVIGIDQRIRAVSDRMAGLLGYAPGDLIGKNWFDTCVPSDIRESIRQSFTVLVTGQDDSLKRYSNRIMASDGSAFTVDWHNAVMKNAEGIITDSISVGIVVDGATVPSQQGS